MNEVRPEALDAMVEHSCHRTAGRIVGITALGGAIARVDEDATAFSGAVGAFDVSADSAWDDASDDELNQAWCVG